MSDEPTSHHLRVPSRTTPTWEVELLISGALVISLFQLIDPLELWFAKWIALVPANREPVVIYSYVYSKMVLFALVGTFVLHIAARANWVALVGIHTIYPDGPRWENLSGGSVSRRVVRKMCGNIDEAIERSDNRATLIFSYGILASQFSFVVLLLTLMVIALSLVFERVVDGNWALLWATGSLTLPILVFTILDRLVGTRLREGGWLARQLERGVRFSILMNLGRFTQPLLPLITTNVGGRRGNWLLLLVFGLVIGIVSLDTVSRRGRLSVLRGEAFPVQSRSSGVNALHYSALRSDTQRFDAAPYIPEEVVVGPYLRLFVAYSPDRHDAAMHRDCASVFSVAKPETAGKEIDEAALREREQTRRGGEAELMACFGRLLDLRLDGAELPQLVLERHRDPFSGHDGGLAMIDVRALPKGRHELEIKRLARARNGLRFATDPPPPSDRIVFWR